MDAKKRSGMVLSNIPGAEKDVETLGKDKPGFRVDGFERIY